MKHPIFLSILFLSRLMMTPNRWGYGYGLYRNPEELFRENPNATLVAHGGAVTGYHAFVGMYDDGTTLIALSKSPTILSSVGADRGSPIRPRASATAAR